MNIENIAIVILCVACILYACYWMKAAKHYDGNKSHKLFDIMILFPQKYTPEGKKYHRIQVVLTIIILVLSISLALLWNK